MLANSPHVPGIGRTLPAKLEDTLREYESTSGKPVHFRAFTVLRSPLSLAHSQFSYWHGASLPRTLFYQLSPELLLFGDAFKLYEGWSLPNDQDACAVVRHPGGIFLDTPLIWGEAGPTPTPTSTPNPNPNLGLPPVWGGAGPVCTSRRWEAACQQVATAIAAAVAQSQQSGHREQRHSESFFTSYLLGCPHPEPSDLHKAVEAANALPTNATYDELDAALAHGLCHAARRRVVQKTQCLVAHAERVRRMVLGLGCDTIIQQALDRLNQLSHVLFMDASKFSLEHAFEIAARDKDHDFPVNTRKLRSNDGKSREPFVESEIEPYNQCSLRFCTYTHAYAMLKQREQAVQSAPPSLLYLPTPTARTRLHSAQRCCLPVLADGVAFAKYTARVPYFHALRELSMLKVPINHQVRLATQRSVTP